MVDQPARGVRDHLERRRPGEGYGRIAFDTHAHLDDARYDVDRDEVIARARAVGVTQILVPGVSPSQWAPLRELCTVHGLLYAVGTHPQCLPVADAIPRDVDGACAIGECGLDGAMPVAMEEQIRVMEGHLALARETDLPLILHCWRAHDRMIATLRRWAPLTGVMHSYSGGPDLVDSYVKMGLHLSFGEPLTWERARKPVASLLRVPRERLLAETDCPRHGHRGEPADVVGVIRAMEKHRGEELSAMIETNARALFYERNSISR